MPLVRQDSEGLYVVVGGWIARPLTAETTHPARWDIGAPEPDSPWAICPTPATTGDRSPAWAARAGSSIRPHRPGEPHARA
ncbi:hypothetical protein [Nocardia miyunensis]|uniref:hypothetical protein n=1 Tax=Nocardia miyunensis TaxID=282684 RepID=UPI000A7CB24A|nr:hypothetical protein [Nocardia miyunensis]